MAKFEYEIVVIGAGPAGESAALNAVKHNLNTAVIDDRPRVGGACTHRGTIPSKALRSSIESLMSFSSNPLIRHLDTQLKISYPQLIQNVGEVVARQSKMRHKFYSRNEIKVFTGVASFKDAHHICVQKQDGSSETISADKVIIASGSRPWQPPDIDFHHPRVYDSDTILEMQHTPRKIVIYGAGVIGCEYASIFSGLGIKVDLINSRERLLEFLDDEISDALSYHLRDKGVMVRHRESYTRVETDQHGICVHLHSGKRVSADALLFCNGRTGNTDQLQLDKIGLSADHRGLITVNQRYQTDCENIYAAGDVIGWPSLASAAYNQGQSASAAARGKKTNQYVDDVATGIYTIPEISSVGKTERELTENCIPYEVGRAFFKETARGQISGQDVGMLKILFHIDTLEILGVHCFGSEATEIIHIGQAIMKQQGEGNSLQYFVSTTFNYPTMAEAYRIAALNGMNRLRRTLE